jgi:hypothetical protein
LQTKDFQNIISYLSACYAQDNRGLHLPDFLNKNKVESIQFIEETEELINESSPKIPIEQKLYKSLFDISELFKKEKELLYGSMFLLGEEMYMGKTRKICSPLLLFPAYLEEKEGYHYASIKPHEYRINTSAIKLLVREGDLEPDVESKILSEFPKAPFDFGAIGKIFRLLQEYFPKLDHESALMFPKLWSLNRIKRQLQPKQRSQIDFFKLIPASALGIVSKSSDTYGILSELEMLQHESHFSKVIHSFFEKSPPLKVGTELKHLGHIPAVLSPAQMETVSNAFDQDVSLLIGPPGTGKSFTISCIAVDYLMNGKSVLISSRQDEAVNVVKSKIEELLQMEGIVFRSGAKGNLVEMRKRLRTLLRRKRYESDDSWWDIQSNQNISQKLSKRLARLERELEAQLEKEISWSKYFADEDQKGLKKFFLEFRQKWRTPHWDILKELNAVQNETIKHNRELVVSRHEKKLESILKSHRKSLTKLYEAMKPSTSFELETTFKEVDFDLILKTYPIWLCKLTELYKALPLKKDMFDLLIIDEASQCDMASVLPAMQRAKKVVFCGDPNQLRHISFLSGSKMQTLANQFQLDKHQSIKFNFRSKSILDLASSILESQDQLNFLNEHFRSEFDIIKFSNKEFYSNDLKIMTQKPVVNEELGTFSILVNGSRNSKGINEEEAFSILRSIKQLISEELEIEPSIKTSIGILSPFRDQVNYISKLIRSDLESGSIRDHNIAIGTAFSFQGEERDVMHLSFVVDSESHHSTFIHLNKADVFNVSITRAKSKQFVYHSLESNQVPQGNYLKKYLESIQEGRSNQRHTHEFEAHNSFLVEVKNFLDQNKVKYWIYYPIAGIPIDLLVKTTSGLKGIDLVGYPGQYEDALSIGRYKILNRASVPIFPLPFSFWKYDLENCKKEVLAFLSDKAKENQFFAE